MKEKTITLVKLVSVICIILIIVIIINAIINTGLFRDISKQSEKISETEEISKVATVYPVSVGNGETVPVPKGFYYVGGSINTGVIISDNEADKYDGKIDKTTHEYATKLKGNQFVWIPCTIDEYTKIDFGMQNMASWDRTTGSAEYAQIQK